MKSIRINKNLIIIMILLVILILGIIYIFNNTNKAYASTDLDQAVNVKNDHEKFENAKYIENSNYFLANPYHHSNYRGDSPNGVCSTVALQLLLGYHNYYTDRNLIPKEVEGKKFLDDTYGDLENHPVFYNGKNYGQGSKSLGLTDTVFDEIVKMSTGYELGWDQMLNNATDGANRFLKAYTSTENDISLTFRLGINRDAIVDEINAGRPVVLGMAGKSSGGDWDFHVVVIYGYAMYNNEFGYIGHWGWGYGYEQMWAPERWFAFQVTMNVEHTHNFVEKFEDVNNSHRKFECDTCGCTTVKCLYQLSEDGSKITGINYKLLDEIVIPEKINNQEIVGIEESAFCDSTIQKIVVPRNITFIGVGAFKNCKELILIELPDRIQYIGDGAFVGCNSLDIKMPSYSWTYTVDGNIIYDKNKTKIIASGKVPETVVIPNTVTEIAPSAFEGNTNLQTVDFGKSNPIIGERAFADCANLQDVYFYSYQTPSISSDSFANDSFAAYAPYISLGDYNTVLNGNANAVTSIQTVLNYISEGQVVYQQDVYYGSVLNNLYLPQRNGYIFNGWYRNSSLQGERVENGILWEETTNANLYADWQTVEYNIYFNLNGGTLSSANALQYTINDSVTFDEPIKAGYTFTGWTVDGQSVNGIDEGTYGDIVVDANWQANQYTVCFDVDGGTPLIEPITVTFNQPFSIGTVPTKYGYFLDGWQIDGVTYLDKNGANVRLWDKTENATLTAKWIVKTYYIKVGENGNIWLDANGNLSDGRKPIPCGTGLDLINMIKVFKDSPAGFKTGSKFDHFEYENKSINWSNGVPDLGVNGAEITIEPVWVLENHTIFFQTQCDILVSPIEAEYLQKITLPTVNRAGYVFNGWFTQAKGGERITWTSMPDLTPNEQDNGSIEIFAQYEAIIYTVTFDNQGGTSATSSIKVPYGSVLQKVAIPQKTGHSFDGYYTEPYGKGTEYYDSQMKGNVWDIASDAVLYANWTPNTYDVTLNMQNGTGGATYVKATYDRVLATVQAPTRSGYDFMGYYSQPNGNGIQYYDENMIGVANWKNASDATLYAYWQAKEYNIVLRYESENGTFDTRIEVTYGKLLPTVDGLAPQKIGHEFVGFFTKRNGEGVQYYKMQIVYDQIGSAIEGIDAYAEGIKPNEYVEWEVDFKDGRYESKYNRYGLDIIMLDNGEPAAILYAHFKLLECDYTFYESWHHKDDEWVFQGKLGERTMHVTHGKTIEIYTKQYDGYAFTGFYLNYGSGKIIRTAPLKFTPELARYKSGEIYVKNTFIVGYCAEECIAQGTLITLADGTQVPVESLKGDEMLLVWNMLTGQNEAAKILFIDKDPAQVYKVINLGFSDGTVVKVISEHGFWNYNLNKYVYLDSTASQYIGHYFNKGNTRVRLTSVDIRDEYTVAYSPVTYKHLCYYVNGMLSMPGGIDGLFNIFEVNADTMTYDIAAMQRDIATYGLFTHEEFAELVPVTEDVFDAFNGQYFKVAIGKGLITVEQLANLANRYSEFFV